MKRQGKISVSLMCADLMNLEREVKALEENGADYLHIDIMDGEFVPNIMLSTEIVNRLKRITSLPLDIHLMVVNPERKINWFKAKENDIICVHAEAGAHLYKSLQLIKETGALAGVAINPATPVSAIEEVLEIADVILIMTVNPGFSGQKLIEPALKKIERLKNMLSERGRENVLIEVDGNVSIINAKKMKESGADIFVAGTSSVYKPGDIKNNFNELKEAIK